MKDSCLFRFALRPFLTLHHTVGAEKPTHLGGLLSERPVNSRGGGSLCVLDKVPGFWSMRCLGVKDLALGHEDTSFCFPHNHVDILYLPLCIQSLSSPLCSVPKRFWLGPGMGTLWQKIRGQTE